MTGLPYLKGKRVEHQLVRLLWRMGYVAVRTPQSGKSIKRIPEPDIIAVAKTEEGHRILVIEVKYRARRHTILLHERSVKALREWARRAGGDPLLVVRIGSESRWHVFTLDMLKEDPRGLLLSTSLYDESLPIDYLKP